MFSHFRRALPLLLLLLLLLTACQPSAPVDATEGTEPEPTDAPTEPAPEPRPNPLTGLQMADDYELQRPVAIMINNIEEATPPKGLSRFDAAFEVLAEGTINRIIAVFYDYGKLGEVGSVRSARDYYFKLVRPLEPIICHYGGSPAAFIYIKNNRLDNLNGIDGSVDRLLYWRDPDRMKHGYEHSVFTSGEKLTATVAELGRSTELSKPERRYFTFRETVSPAGPLEAGRITVPFSNYITAKFEYDATAEHYLRSQFGKPHIDANDGSQIAVDNLFVLFAPHKNVPGDADGRIEVGVVGSGSGFYFSRGKGVAINWSKAGDTEFFTLTKEDGEPLAVNAGNMWFCIVKPTAKVAYEPAPAAETPEAEAANHADAD